MVRAWEKSTNLKQQHRTGGNLRTETSGKGFSNDPATQMQYVIRIWRMFI